MLGVETDIEVVGGAGNAADALAGIADTGTILPLLSGLSSDQQSLVGATAHALLEHS